MNGTLFTKGTKVDLTGTPKREVVGYKRIGAPTFGALFPVFENTDNSTKEECVIDA